ncbi:ABC transporter permease [Sphingomonas turrisvirgatae]|uniref:Transport permease protein n=1 Tax=Sphingomonas turrisvirgatae TaxID=1888892 RepID=A0A1E3LRW2_9SPHN|nr:ABC transporter permease [Sphingomonas turrisvirgatae]ODP36478.1 ABC transporter [Sphingomonas turrisvirgatae]
MQAALRYQHWRDLLIELIARDLKVRYQRSFIGIGWSLMKPLMQLAVFSLVFGLILPLNIEHYTTFVFAGVLIWSWFSGAVGAGTNAISSSKELVRRPGFPVMLLPLLTVLGHGVHFVLALPLVIICAMIDVGLPGAPLLALPVMVLLQLLLTVGLVYFLSAAHVFMRDTEHLVALALTVAFYVTPVFYRPIQKTHDLSYLNTWNPMAWVLEGYRAILVYGEWPSLVTMGKILAFGMVTLAASLWWFARVSPRFDEEL